MKEQVRQLQEQGWIEPSFGAVGIPGTVRTKEGESF